MAARLDPESLGEHDAKLFLCFYRWIWIDLEMHGQSMLVKDITNGILAGDFFVFIRFYTNYICIHLYNDKKYRVW